MLIDWKLMENGYSPYINRKIVIYGASSSGENFFKYLKKVHYENKVVAFCDSDPQKYNSNTLFLGKKILSPQQLIQRVDEGYLVVIASCYLKEIKNKLEELGYKHDFCSEFAIKIALHIGILSGQLEIEKQIQEEYECEINFRSEVDRCYRKKMVEFATVESLNSLLSIKNPIIVHSSEKTGNRSLCNSMEKYPNFFWSKHYFYIGDNLEKIHNILKLKKKTKEKIKILCGVRNPIELKISMEWQGIEMTMIRNRTQHYNKSFVFSKQNDNCKVKLDADSKSDKGIYRWFDDQLKYPFGIDVFAEKLHMDKGWTILENDNIQVFLYKTEKLNCLEQEIGEFIGDENFQLKNENQAKDKSYALAYEEYKKHMVIPKEWIEEQVRLARHFYTEEELSKELQKYQHNI